MEDYNHLADFVKIFNCEEKIIKYAIFKIIQVCKIQVD